MQYVLPGSAVKRLHFTHTHTQSICAFRTIPAIKSIKCSLIDRPNEKTVFSVQYEINLYTKYRLIYFGNFLVACNTKWQPREIYI